MPFRVLMIHSDDGKNKNALKPLIRNKQVTLKVIMKATDILDTLTSFSPEVVVLGNNITGCSPNEIAQVIEQQKLVLGIPIIFLMNDNTVPSEVQLSSFNHTFIKLEDMAGDKIKKLIDNEVQKVNDKVARVEQIKKFRLIDVLLTADDDEMTATMKLKRGIVEKKYKSVINSMYK